MLDIFIICISLVEWVILYIAKNENTEFLRVFKALRALRLLKLTKFIAGMRQVLRQAKRSIISIGSFSSLLVLLIFVFALLGMELFAYRTVQDEQGNFIVPQKAFELLQ